mmetsp:Transcript_6976/g.25715  ORF Transcript_6976/g.25715 Transcript_6976/m.25715 type:complete len:275 (+) Transcript_6976:57-881(+)
MLGALAGPAAQRASVFALSRCLRREPFSAKPRGPSSPSSSRFEGNVRYSQLGRDRALARDVARRALVASAASEPQRTPQVLVPIAEGSEEMEAVIVIDVLRRAGVDVTVASVEETLQVKASRGVNLVADVPIAECASKDYDLIVLPGGMPGAERLRDSSELQALLEHHANKSGGSFGVSVAAICAAPAVVLQPAGLLEGKKSTCHPAFEAELADASCASSRVVHSGGVMTSKGPGTAMEFALALVKQLCGEDAMRSVAGPMVMLPGWDTTTLSC